MNVAVDALSRKPHGILASLALEGWKKASTVKDYNQQYYEDENVALDYNVTATPSPAWQRNLVARCRIKDNIEQTVEW